MWQVNKIEVFSEKNTWHFFYTFNSNIGSWCTIFIFEIEKNYSIWARFESRKEAISPFCEYQESEANIKRVSPKMHPNTGKGVGKEIESTLFHFQSTLFFPSQLCVLLLSISFLLIAYHKKSVSEFTSITLKLLTQIWPKCIKRSVMKVVRT